MPAAPPPADEPTRLAALHGLGILDSPPDDAFDAVVRAASLACGVPISLISLIDDERQWFKANTGLPGVSETPRELAFCGHAILGDELLEVPDAQQDARFADNPLVTGAPHIRFYAGAKLCLPDGHAVGTLSVIDREPRRLDAAQREILRALGRVAAHALESWRIARAQQLAARALEDNQERLRSLYEKTPAMLHSIDSQGVLRTVSDVWLTKLGYTREEVIGRPGSDFLTPASGERSRAEVQPRLFATGAITDVEYQMVRKDGTVLDVLVSAILDPGAEGEAPRSLSVMEDITARRRAERALAAEHRRLSNILDSTGLGTWEWHVPSDELRISERWAAMIGYTRAELAPMTGSRWRDLIHPDDLGRVMSLRARHLNGEAEFYQTEYRLRHRDGSWVWVLGRGTVVSRAGDGAPEWMLGTSKDITERKRQEEALRKSEDFLERIGRVAGVGGWELDLATNELHWSAETCRIIGAPPDYQPTLEAAVKLYAPDSQPVIAAAVQRAAATGEGWDLELEFIRLDGQPIWVRAVGAATCEDGRPVRLSGAFQDITQKVAERRALEAANEHVRLATENAGIGLWQRDFVAGRSSWNDQTFRLFGLAPRDADSMPLWQDRLHPDDSAAVNQAMQDAIAGKAPYDLEYRIIWRDGSVHHLKAAAVVTRDAAGRPLRMLGAVWDVTESRMLAAELRQRAEQAAEAAERERALFLNSPDLLSIIRVEDNDGAIRFRYEAVNPALQKITGWRSEDVVGRRPEYCLPPDVAAAMSAQYLACVKHGRTHAYEVTAETPLGQRQYEGYLTPIRHPATGRIVRLASAVRDVTERNMLQARQLHGQKMEAIGRLAAGVAHDFNNILQSISGSLETALDDLAPGTSAHQIASIGLRAARRGAHLTHHLLSYARKQMLQPRLVELPALLSDVEQLLGRTLGSHVVITVRTDPAARLVKVDPGQIQTALLNLGINAAQAMPNGGRLLIETRAEQDAGRPGVAIIVTDTGIGMDAATVARAVEPFFSTKGLNGSGLGLSMVQGFAEQSGGRLSIASRPGEGTRVTLHLPIAAAAEDEAATAMDAPFVPAPAASAPAVPVPVLPEPAKACVLLVDDDPDVLVTTGAFLEKAGFRVLCASGGSVALAILAGPTPVDAIVTDYAMPGMTGSDLIAEAGELRPGLPGVIISGYIDLLLPGRPDGAGLITVQKPFQREALVAALEQAMSGAPGRPARGQEVRQDSSA